MQNVEIRQLDLSPRYKAHLLKAQYTTAAEVLLTPLHQLRQRVTLAPAELDQLVLELSHAVLARPDAQCRSIASLTEVESGKISFRDPALDLLFDGGVRVGTLTEIAGQSASGKTHLCLQLVLNVQLARSQGGLAGGALFISSEGTLSTTRLLSLASHMPDVSPDDSLERSSSHRTVWDYLDNVHIEKAPDVDTLEAVVSYHAPAAIERIQALAAAHSVDPDLASLLGNGDEPAASQYLSEHRHTRPRPPLPIRLVVLDSIAAPLRAAHETASSGFVERSKELVTIGDQLKRIAHVYRCAVVVVNQVQDVFERSGPLPPHLVEHAPSSSPHRPEEEHSASFLSMPPPWQSRTISSHVTPSRMSRAHSTASSASSSSNWTDPLPPPHVQYSLPPLMYTRFQAPHSTGASIVPPNRTGPKVSAALGTTWTNLINTRVVCLVSRTGQSDRAVRELHVVFGPEVKRGKVRYEVREEGVRTIEDVEWRRELESIELDPDRTDMQVDGDEVDRPSLGRVEQVIADEDLDEDMGWNPELELACSAIEQTARGHS
ncbi:uncharacterized protein JCM15063_000305 [Sporobolomyces koalae]|uniref:uncharacterized protein n=1 Tax=Sporobolomyces koalae TaxID=500713 RepID=UPI00316DE4C2